ncbi:MAG: tetratricopeptide repeat protein, partial [Flavobacteriales bacterium]|nr:tetratricopeptide repeat protein [Flavobacteriales bacterium]
VIFIYFFKKHEVNKFALLKVFLIAVIVTGGLQGFIIPGIVSLAGKFELFFINTVGLPFNTGTIIYFILIISGIVFGLIYANKNNKDIMGISLVSFAAILIGYSTFFILVIRSNADTPIDENNPEDAVSLLAYLNREQYGDWPILNGQYYNAKIIDLKDGNPVYTKDEDKGEYVITNDRKNSKPVYDPKFSSFFPRMWSSSQASHAKAYQQWSGQKNAKRPPTFSQNLKYFFNYQIGHMYWRYFMWNFSGRQNDIQGHGEINKGNWLSGIPFIDNNLRGLGPQDIIPENMAKNKGRNIYFMLPFLLGVIGMLYQFNKNNKDAFVVLLLFLFTGLAIVVYLNQYPYQPRERDYAYVGSFYAYSIWVGLGVLAVIDFLSKKLSSLNSSVVATALCLLLVPTLMAKENWDDHDRSDRYTARDVAANYLNSCAPNAIIFTNGDNDTFPLWYAQEVEGVRTDIRVVNLSLFNTDWYIDQMKRAAYDAAPIPSSMEWDKYKQGTRDYVIIRDNGKGYVDVKDVVNFIASDNDKTKGMTRNGQKADYCPTNKLKIPINKADIIRKGIVAAEDSNRIVDEVKWELKGNSINKNEMMVLDILANFNWDRPIYFAITVGSGNFMGLEKYFQLEGLAYRFVPYLAKSADGQTGEVASDIMYDNLINKFNWGNMQDPNVYLDETNMRMTMNFRNNFVRLAEALIREGDFERAENVIDRCLEVMPNEAIPFNYFNLPMAEVYYKIGKLEKAKEIVSILTDSYFNELEYYNTIDDKILSKLQREYQLANQIVSNLYSITTKYKDNESQEKIVELYNQYQ